MKNYSIKILVTIITCIIALTACSTVVANSVSRETIETSEKTETVQWKASSDSTIAIKRVEPIRKKEASEVDKENKPNKKIKKMTDQQVIDFVNSTDGRAYGGNEAREHGMNKYKWVERRDGTRYNNVYEFVFLSNDRKSNMHVFWAMDHKKKEGMVVLFTGKQNIRNTDFKYKED